MDESTDNLPVYSVTGNALDLAVLDGIVLAGKNISNEGGGITKAVVVPHHLVASKSIALGIKALTASSPRLVIVISPDHFSRCPKLICATKGSYKTYFGDVFTSKEEVIGLEKSDLVADSNLFGDEHGIFNIMPFIKYYLPEAQVVSMVISQNGRGTEQERSEILELLKPLLTKKDTALVISSDFSHYLALTESNEMDKKTQNSFCSGNSQEILALQNPSQNDCPLCLWILEQEAKKLGFWNPRIVAHTNSADLLRDTSVKETTSHFTIIFSDDPLSGNCLITAPILHELENIIN
ncbi:MAG: AmmeMemoRadiSam system protein B [Candidatus Gracilibacteria bacterium]